MYKHFLLAFLSGQRTHSASCLVHKHGAQVWRDCQLSSGFFTRSLLIKLRERFLCTTFTIKNYCTAAVTIRLRSRPLSFGSVQFLLVLLSSRKQTACGLVTISKIRKSGWKILTFYTLLQVSLSEYAGFCVDLYAFVDALSGGLIIYPSIIVCIFSKCYSIP